MPIDPVKVPFTLEDGAERDQAITGRLVIHANGLEVFFDGHSTFGHPGGAPIWIELYDGQVVVRVWADLGRPDPTDEISLQTARETPSGRQFHRTTFEVVVLSEDPYDPASLLQIAHDIRGGDCSGEWHLTRHEKLFGPEAAQALLAQDSAPEFFGLTETGEDLRDR